jgi:hypothetical protein
MSWKVRIGWAVIGAVVFTVYAFALLWNGFRSQEQLRAEADARLLSDSAGRAAAIGDFLVQLRNDAATLAESQEIANYNANKALGMSPLYGLNVNLDAIEEMFRRKQAQIAVRGQQVFERIRFLDEGHLPLAEVVGQTRSSAASSVTEIPAKAVLILDLSSGILSSRAPVHYRGNLAGTVVADADIRQLSRYIITGDQSSGLHELLLDANSNPLSSQTDPSRSLIDRLRVRSAVSEQSTVDMVKIWRENTFLLFGTQLRRPDLSW